MREFVTGFVAKLREERAQNNIVVVTLVGPNGGTRALEALTEGQARTLRDNLSLALTRFDDERALNDSGS